MSASTARSSVEAESDSDWSGFDYEPVPAPPKTPAEADAESESMSSLSDEVYIDPDTFWDDIPSPSTPSEPSVDPDATSRYPDDNVARKQIDAFRIIAAAQSQVHIAGVEVDIPFVNVYIILSVGPFR